MSATKRFSLALLLSCTIAHSRAPQIQDGNAPQIQDCSIAIESRWEDLENNKEKSQKFGGKWILAGTITFKKKCNAQVNLQEIRLQWHGKQLDQLSGELFTPKDSGPFKPIRDNHLADGTWSKTTQTLILKFDRGVSLHPITVFHLVLTVPENQEQRLKGQFTIEPDYLPTPFQEAAQKEPLSINLDVSGSTIH